MTTEWRKVATDDEYAASGDTHYVSGRNWLWYWNAERKVLRRYGNYGEYDEVPYRHRPDPHDGNLSRVLSAIFRRKL